VSDSFASFNQGLYLGEAELRARQERLAQEQSDRPVQAEHSTPPPQQKRRLWRRRGDGNDATNPLT